MNPRTIADLAITGSLLIAFTAVGVLFQQTAHLRSQQDLAEALAERIAKFERSLKAANQRISRIERAGEAPAVMATIPANGPESGAADSGTTPAGGTEGLARLGKLDPEFLESLQSKHDFAKVVEIECGKLRERKNEQRKADLARYGAGIADLGRQALAGGAEGDAALNQLIAQYPAAYTTGAAIADRALTAALNMNSEDAEKYYNLLTANDTFDQVVTESGFEATPALRSYLARKYISDGNYQQAENLINQLAGDSERLVPEPGRGSEPSWVTGRDLAQALGNELASAITNNVQGIPGPRDGVPPAPP